MKDENKNKIKGGNACQKKKKATSFSVHINSEGAP